MHAYACSHLDGSAIVHGVQADIADGGSLQADGVMNCTVGIQRNVAAAPQAVGLPRFIGSRRRRGRRHALQAPPVTCARNEWVAPLSSATQPSQTQVWHSSCMLSDSGMCTGTCAHITALRRPARLLGCKYVHAWPSVWHHDYTCPIWLCRC